MEYNKITAAGAVHINTLLDAGCQLLILHLGRNQLGDAGVQAICPSLIKHKDIIRLHLEENGITAVGAQALLKNLPLQLNLLDISTLLYDLLGHNNILDAGLVEVNNMLTKNKALNVLYLDNCGISDACAENIARSAKTTGKLKYLFMSIVDLSYFLGGNNLSAAGKQKIATIAVDPLKATLD